MLHVLASATGAATARPTTARVEMMFVNCILMVGWKLIKVGIEVKEDHHLDVVESK